MFDLAQFLMSAPPLTVAAAIIFAAFISEDAATVAAATLAATNALEPKLAFASSVLGIWVGDLGLYGLAHRYGSAALSSSFVSKFVKPESLERGRRWFNRHNSIALFVSRCMPGTRLPVSLAAGTFRMPIARFATIGIAGAITWVALNFAVVHYSQTQLHRYIPSTSWAGFVIGTMLLAILAGLPPLAKRLTLKINRWSQWEFWPAWLFYIPVVGMWIYLSIKYGGFSLPALANPRQKNGGLVGESKSEILAELANAAPHYVAEAFLIAEGELDFRVAQLLSLITEGRLQLPFVIKPDVGQRGAGFKKISSVGSAIFYLACVPSAVVVQRYVPGPFEAGIFYVRLPGQQRGDILAITDKRFPEITGDGFSTLEELIRRDPRATMIAATYLQRFAYRRADVLDLGEKLRLVEAGNHCQGCVFDDGMHLYTEALRNRIDEISRALPEFYIGRYDIRYSDADSLRRGEGFQVIELNGAASEATSIYDSRNTLLFAYRTLYKQWKLVFAAGAANLQRGYAPPSLFQLGRDWMAYTQRAKSYPLAD